MLELAPNPLLPTGYDLVWSAVFAVLVVFVICSVVSLFRHAQDLSVLAFFLWIIAVLSVPFIGAALWFVFGRPAVRQRTAAS